MRLSLVSLLACFAASALAGCGGKSATAPSSSSSPPLIQTILDLVIPNPVRVGPAKLAQSITIPAGAALNNIRFRWTPSSDAPPLTGSLYIIDREYLGPLSALSTAPGLVARSTRIESGEYVFEPTVTLAGGTQYWFGSDSPVGYVCSQPTSGDLYPGGELYFQGSLTSGEDSYARASLFNPSERLDAGFSLRGARVQ